MQECHYSNTLFQKAHSVGTFAGIIFVMRFTLITIIIFIASVVGFFFFFGPPISPDPDSLLSQRGVKRAWMYCSLLFIVGTATACFGDKQYGLFPPASLRWLFIVSGGAIMVASAAWMHSLQSIP